MNTETPAAAPVPTQPRRLPSLRRRMLWRVLLPLALTWLGGTAIVASVAQAYIARAFDRAMLDDAYAIAANVSEREGLLHFNLSPREVGAVLFDRDERVYFAVLARGDVLVAGQGGLREAIQPWPETFGFGERHYHGVDLRTVTLVRSQPQPFAVVVGQTTRGRAQLLQQLLLASVLPQAALLLLLGLWLRRSVAQELQPLQRLEDALGMRGATDLQPLALQPRSRDIALLTEAFNALMARIRAGVRAQREFAGNVAHELRTPLAGIRALADYGLAQADADSRGEQLRRIAESQARASHLVDQLLALALADEARDGVALQRLDLAALLQDLLVRRLPEAEAQGVDLGAEGLERAAWVRGAPALIEGLVGNLLDNALRYGRPTDAAVAPQITVALQPSADEWLLTVSDNGPGLPEGEAERLQQRWAQGAGAAERGTGSGLGLAIVRRYVELLGARIDLRRATAGGGLRVCVWLASHPVNG